MPYKEAILFVKNCAPVKPKSQAKSGPQIVSSKDRWKLDVDLQKFMFHQHNAMTTQHPDMVLWSDSVKTVIILELTVPWDKNRVALRDDDVLAQ